MTTTFSNQFALAALFLAAFQPFTFAAESSDIQRQVQELRDENQKLRDQLQKQERQINALSERMTKISETSDKSNDETLSDREERTGLMEKFTRPLTGGRLNLTGEAGMAFFHTSSRGAYPKSEFLIDEAKLFLDAKVFDDVYFFTELNLTTRESNDEFLHLGELYVDFENVSRFFGRERMLNLRVGRFDIPFGEEYLTRDAIDNPLISHSLSDFWGVDEGIEAYGSLGKFGYVLAVQNGGHPMLNDYTSDKAVVGRFSYDPKNWLHLSVSGMRTGGLSVDGDELSELWFGNGFIRNLGSAATRFHAEVVQGNVEFRIKRGHLKFAGGYLQSDDNDPRMNSSREVYFYSAEGLHQITDKLYGALRFSQILAERGMPIVGNGTFGRYFFNSANLTEDLWRLSAGLGYRWSRNLVLKTEYSFEEGRLIRGRTRSASFIGAEIAIGF